MTSVELSDPFYARGEHLAIDLGEARVVFTTRRGGVSRGPFTDFNLGLLTDDDPEAVEHNRATLAEDLGVTLGFVRQVHGTEVVPLTVESAWQAISGGVRPADGQYTTERELGAVVFTADCLPVAVAGEGAVAMVHAGWRGLAGGVIAAGVRALRRQGVDGPLAAAIGPGAGPCCYEVGEEVHAAFAEQPNDVHRNGNLDLPAIARHELVRAGVETVYDIGICTICSPELLFSHRRDRGITGRQVGVAWLRS
jgi:YfiH family protein